MIRKIILLIKLLSSAKIISFPYTGLDVTNQKIVIDTFNDIRLSNPDITMIFISHVFVNFCVSYAYDMIWYDTTEYYI